MRRLDPQTAEQLTAGDKPSKRRLQDGLRRLVRRRRVEGVQQPTVAEGWPAVGCIEFQHLTAGYDWELQPGGCTVCGGWAKAAAGRCARTCHACAPPCDFAPLCQAPLPSANAPSLLCLAAALSDVCLRIPAGTSCAVVGHSGSGKSTLVLALTWLIPHLSGTLHTFFGDQHQGAPLLPPLSAVPGTTAAIDHLSEWLYCTGNILLDGVDLRLVPTQRLRAGMAVVPQEPVVFKGGTDRMVFTLMLDCEGGLGRECSGDGGHLSLPSPPHCCNYLAQQTAYVGATSLQARCGTTWICMDPSRTLHSGRCWACCHWQVCAAMRLTCAD